MKVIFLDIDGVLNYTKWYIDDRNPGTLYGQEGDIDPFCVCRILRICEETDAKVVISSTWKDNWVGCKIRLEKSGLTREYVIDKTPGIPRGKRGDEIQLFLDMHPEVTNYAIIDDRIDFLEDQQPHFVHIDPMYGITENDADIAIMILNHH